MQREINTARTANTVTGIQQAEDCLRIAGRYQDYLAVCMSRYEFRDREERTAFFRNIGPAFYAEADYWQMVRFSFLCGPPEEDRLAWADFWRRQQKKIQLFRLTNLAFIGYMESGDTARDEEFFARPGLDIPPFCMEPVTDGIHTRYDLLLARWMALQRFEEYSRCRPGRQEQDIRPVRAAAQKQALPAC